MARRHRQTKRKRARRRKTRSFRTQKGGAIIGEGSYGIVFRPSPCPGAGPNTVGKLMPEISAQEEYNMSKAIYDALPMRHRDNFFVMGAASICDVDRNHPEIKALENAPAGTSHRKFWEMMVANMAGYPATTHSAPIPPMPYKILTFDYAGVPLQEYVADMFTGRPSYEVINARLNFFVRGLASLFFGIRELSEIGITHRDIKPANITVETHASGKIKSIRFIDLGIAVVNSKIRDYPMAEESLSYQYFPLEAIVSITNAGIGNCLADKDKFTAIAFNAGGRDEYLSKVRPAMEQFAVDTPDTRKEVVGHVLEKLRVHANSIFVSMAPSLANIYLSLVSADGTGIHWPAYQPFIAAVEALADGPEKAAKVAQLELLNQTIQMDLLKKFDVYSLGITLHHMISAILLNRSLKSSVIAAAQRAGISGVETTESIIEGLNLILELCGNMMHWDIFSRPTALESEQQFIAILLQREEFHVTNAEEKYEPGTLPPGANVEMGAAAGGAAGGGAAAGGAGGP